MIHAVLTVVYYDTRSIDSGVLWYTQYWQWCTMIHAILTVVYYDTRSIDSGVLWYTQYWQWCAMIHAVLTVVYYDTHSIDIGILWYTQYWQWCTMIHTVLTVVSPKLVKFLLPALLRLYRAINKYKLILCKCCRCFNAIQGFPQIFI